MSKFQELKRELSILEKTFGPRHEHFRVEANGLDEVTCRFLATNGEHVVHCNIFVSKLWLNATIDRIVASFKEYVKAALIFFMLLVKQESYPNPPPMWFAESEDAKIAQILEFLSSIEPSAPNLVRWVHLFFNFDEIFPHNFEEWPYVNWCSLFSICQLLRSTKYLAKELYKWQDLPVPSHIDNLDLVQLIHVSSFNWCL